MVDVIESTAAPTAPAANAKPRHFRIVFSAGMLVGLMLASGLVYLFRGHLGPEVEGRILVSVAPGHLAAEGLPGFARVRLAPGARELALTVAIPAVLDNAQVANLAVSTPDGRTLLERPLQPQELRRSSLLLLLRQASALEPGVYRVRFGQRGLLAPLESHFEILAAD